VNIVDLKKLLFVISSLEGSGGSERSLTMRVNYLVKHFDYLITIVTTRHNSTGCFYYLDPRISIVNIPISFSKHTIKDKLRFLFNNSHSEEKPLLDFIFESGFHICSSLGSETFLYRDKRRNSFIKVKENRFTYKKMFNDEGVSLARRIWRLFLFRNAIDVQRKMDYIVTLTDEDKDFWSKYLSNITVMPNFIDLNSINVPVTRESKRIIAVGRLEKEKDFSSLIYSVVPVFRRFVDWRLDIYGDGSLREELEDLIISLGLRENVFLNGSTSDIYSKYTESSIYAITSFYEGFGNATLEAMSFGLPVIGFESVGGVKILLKDSYNGFLIKNRNIEQFGDKMIRLIKDDELREIMGKNSRIISEEFDQEKVMLGWHNFYTSILEK
jgi:glycosyltransferase involved in cell wall biosynthesis